MRIGPVKLGLLDVLLVFVPVSIVLELTHAPAAWIFVSTCVAIIPLAGWMGRATEHLAAHFGAGVGGLLNASFGNAAEFIIALAALRRGLNEVVQASLTGSIIGNILLVLGLSVLCGGIVHEKQTFNRTAARLGTTLLTLSVVGLVVPGFFALVVDPGDVPALHNLSVFVAIVLLVSYIFSLFFSLRTHAHLYAGDEGTYEHADPWGKATSAVALIVATALVALMSELLVGSVEETGHAWGLNHVFIGVILVAIVGNAAEHSTAVIMAIKNKMDLAVNIAVGSGIQVALLIAPLLVLLSVPLGHPLELDFTPLELIAVALSVIVVSLVANDGETHWMEGVLLLAVYAIFAAAFFLLPA